MRLDAIIPRGTTLLPSGSFKLKLCNDVYHSEGDVMYRASELVIDTARNRNGFNSDLWPVSEACFSIFHERVDRS